ncbi:MAG: hypothetical protein LC136_16665 [Burkholderiales bacterium]|jgi:hypothetical protein|nr:hypothetical protein [Burkholderiaceae bacterium]MCZ2415879.1 hypothetical protein [Burkholderiales bacterium]
MNTETLPIESLSNSASWQEAVSDAFAEAAGTAPFADALRQWAQPSASSPVAGQGKARR